MSSADSYRFTFADNSVVKVEEFDDGRWEEERIERDESYVRDGNAVIKIETERSGSSYEITRYEDVDRDGVFIEVSETWQKTPPVVNLGNDTVYLKQGIDATGGAGADRFVHNTKSDVRILDFKGAEGDKLVFDTSTGLKSIDDLARYLVNIQATENREVQLNFGEYGQITLVGVNVQDLSWQMVDVIS